MPSTQPSIARSGVLDQPIQLGLFGGSFDPVHLGHLLVAEAAREEANLARLFYIPTAQSPFKPDSTPTAADSRAPRTNLRLPTWI